MSTRNKNSSEDEDDDDDTIWTRRVVFQASRFTIEEDYHAGIGGTLWEGAVLMARWLSCPEAFLGKKYRGGRLIELGAGVAGIPGIVAAHLGCFKEVVITDLEECLERLHENVLRNSQNKYDVAKEIARQQRQLHVNAQSSQPLQPSSNALYSPDISSETKIHDEDDAMPHMKNECSKLPSGQVHSGAHSQMNRASGQDLILAAQANGIAAVHQQMSAAAPAATASDLQGGHTAVHVCELDWVRGCDHIKDPAFDVVLVADVLYEEDLVEPLLQSMVTLSRPDSLVAIAIYNRSARASARFWQLLPSFFQSHRKVPEVSFNSPAQSDDIGIFLLSR